MKTITSEEFRITYQPSGIFSPGEGESWEKGSTQYIKWHIDSHAAFVHISYSNNKGKNWTPIECKAPNKGYYTWTISDREEPSNDCFIKIEEVAG